MSPIFQDRSHILKLCVGKVAALIPQVVTTISAAPWPGLPCVTSFFCYLYLPLLSQVEFATQFE